VNGAGGQVSGAGGPVSGDFELIDKTELRIENVGLDGANLNEVAGAVARILEIAREEVFVIDARDNLLTLDILRTTIDPYRLIGKDRQLIAALGQVPGVSVSERTSICSQGVLGWVMVEAAFGNAALDRSREMTAQIQSNIARRAIVFATGPEVIDGQIEDTNSPAIAKLLSEQGYKVTQGAALVDDRGIIAAHLREAATERGFGLVITTGGVGAEAKDHTVEALLSLDPEAATPYLAKFRQGTGRHVKDGIRIGVARLGQALLVALPGPNDEVRLGMQALVEGLSERLDKTAIAGKIADVLRRRWRGAHAHAHTHHHA
jgi:molybdenum cofactor synthesis domain-containing protein